jgi:hypothetical protein
VDYKINELFFLPEGLLVEAHTAFYTDCMTKHRKVPGLSLRHKLQSTSEKQGYENSYYHLEA